MPFIAPQAENGRVRSQEGVFMDRTPGDSDAGTKFTFNPTNKVVGIIDEAGDAKVAVRELMASGFPAQEVELLTDEEGARRIDMGHEERGVFVHIFHPTQNVPSFYDAPVIVRRVEQELLAGHYCVGVVAKDGEARERARDILRSHSGHFINFYGRWAAEALEP
jgi:hypothetical protein